MKTDGVFNVGEKRIKFDRYGQDISIFAISDVHWNSPSCDRAKWKQFLYEARNTENAYFIFLGDLFDSLSTSERRAMRAGEFHESTLEKWEDMYANDVKEFCKECQFMKGRVIGVLGGNHYFSFQSGITSDQIVASELKAQYLGCNALIRLYMDKDKHHSHYIDICGHHGLGGGRTSGASINKLELMSKSFDADIMLMGHDHNRCVDYVNRLGLSDAHHGEIELINKRILLARTGSFLRSYEPKRASYAVDAMMSPSDLGALKIVITPKRLLKNDKTMPSGRKDKRWIDIRAEV